MRIIDKVKKYIQEEDLIASSHPVILVGLSGGADSVALLRILMELGYQCIAAHCNFWLRDRESLRDEEFVTQLCKKLEVTLYKIEFDTHSYAKEKAISIEMAARELRYNWFYELKKETQASSIAVAHHIDDNIETLLLNLIRGTGIKGLTGIPPKNQDIIRPLLCISRDEITDYLNTLHQDYVTDSTNLEAEYTRNQIRLNILPLFEEINPSVKNTLNETISRLRETEKIYRDSINKGIQRVYIDGKIAIDKIRQERSPSTLLYEILYPLGFTPQQIESIHQSLNKQSGKQFFSEKWKVLKDRNFLILEEKEKVISRPELEFHQLPLKSDYIIPKDKNTACLDADKLTSPLTVRKWQVGDTFIPFGMKGRKKISDYLTDRKFSLYEKDNIWVLCSGNQIAWVINERIDQRFSIDNTTKNIVVIQEKK